MASPMLEFRYVLDRSPTRFPDDVNAVTPAALVPNPIVSAMLTRT
jgi:hypothetical protein